MLDDLDETDLKILRTMQADGGLSISEIAEQVGLSQSPCSRRVARLRSEGVLTGKHVELDRRKLGFTVDVVARVKLDKHDKASLRAFVAEIEAVPEIQYAILLMGGYDYHLHVVARDIDHYKSLLYNNLATIPGVQEIESSVVLDIIKQTSELPI